MHAAAEPVDSRPKLGRFQDVVTMQKLYSQNVPADRPGRGAACLSLTEVIMAYNEELAGRIRGALAHHEGMTERKMFGGIAFMLNGNMCCGVVGDELMARVGADGHQEALALPHARPMDFTGRPMKGFICVGAQGLQEEADLAAWTEWGQPMPSPCQPSNVQG